MGGPDLHMGVLDLPQLGVPTFPRWPKKTAQSQQSVRLTVSTYTSEVMDVENRRCLINRFGMCSPPLPNSADRVSFNTSSPSLDIASLPAVAANRKSKRASAAPVVTTTSHGEKLPLITTSKDSPDKILGSANAANVIEPVIA